MRSNSVSGKRAFASLCSISHPRRKKENFTSFEFGSQQD